jgi:integrase
VLRHTGFRGSDAVDGRFKEFKNGFVNRLTQKKKKWVSVALHPELQFALEGEIQRRQPQEDERILLNPFTGRSLSRPRLYERIKALGQRAGVNNAYPHRFRDTFAVDMLLKGATPYEVAQYLGDAVGTIEKYYASWVKEFLERSKRIIEGDGGLENLDTQGRNQLLL